MSTQREPPAPLRRDTVEARLLKQKVWRRCNVKNLHFMAAVVGREGHGKSYTGLKIAECCDPTFNADRVMFDPESFLRRLRDWKEQGITQGKVVVADEAGVGVGVRTWYEKDQIKFNQVLQVIRDENMAIIFTLPRLNELDSQARGRLHAYLEMTDIEKGEWAELKWLNWEPTRDERDKIYRNYPEMRIDGRTRKVKRIKLSPPSQEVIGNYERRKTKFQNELYDNAIEEMEDSDDDDEQSVNEIAVEIVNDEKLSKLVSRHNQTKQPFINKQLIRAEYELSHADASAVKSVLEKRFDKSDLEKWA